MLLVMIMWKVKIGVIRANDHLFQAEVLFPLCMLLVRIIRVVNTRVARAKDHLFQSEVLFHPLHVTSEDHKGGKYKVGQSEGSPVPI
jgi:hypothetical protein